MGRNAILHIKNETGRNLTYVRHNVMHGKFQKGKNPPNEIKVGETKTFEVGNCTGAKIGPKGTVTYKLDYASGITVELTFFWDHPFSHHLSAYQVHSNPPWFGSYYLNPPDSTGHNQELTYVVRLNDYGFDPKEWMNQLGRSGNDILIRDMLIPGSHDSGTYNIPVDSKPYFGLDIEEGFLGLLSKIDFIGALSGWAKAQKGTIYDQLCAGIRYFDLRVSNGKFVTLILPKVPITTVEKGSIIKELEVPNVVEKSQYISHSMISAKVEEIISDIKKFIDTHPKEIIILNFQHFYNMSTNDYQNLIQLMKSQWGNKIVKRTKEKINKLSLKKLQNDNQQIILIFDQDHLIKSPGEGSGESFKTKNDKLFSKYEEIWSAQDCLYNKWPNTSDQTELHDYLLKIMNKKSEIDGKLFVLQGILSPSKSMYLNAVTGTYPKNLKELGIRITPEVISWVNNEWYSKHLNIIMCDWVEDSVITQVCYMLNKHYKSSIAK